MHGLGSSSQVRLPPLRITHYALRPMSTDTGHDLNSNNWGPAGPYREMVPPGTSYKTAPPPPPKPTVSAWQRVQIARHPDRPHTLDYIQRLCTDFVELHGDRLFG